MSSLSRFAALFAIVTVAAAGFFVFSSGPVVIAQDNSCRNTFGWGQPVPANFGAAFNVFSPNRELLIRGADCAATPFCVDLGTGDQSQYIFNRGYVWEGTRWNQVNLTSSGQPLQNTWYQGQATAAVASQSGGDSVFFIGYICQRAGNAWRCGCSDAACNRPRWQLQEISRAPELPPIDQSPSPSPHPSGLPWSSGISLTDPVPFAAWRGRPVDNFVVWPLRQTWNQVSHPDNQGDLSETPANIKVAIGLAMLPEGVSGVSLAKCATGAYDQYFKTFGSELVRLGRGESIVRLGWEANGDWYSWSATSNPANYIACFRKEAAAIKSTAPQVKIDWNMNKDSHMGSTSVVNAYPGDDVVDIIGVDFYDWWPSYKTQADWDADYNSTQNGGPRGIGAWLNFAKAHEKKLSVPEWGVINNANGGGDNPFYIEKMHDFFKTNALDIAYEAYFNGDYGDYISQLYPVSQNPNASAKYQQLWSMPVNGNSVCTRQASLPLKPSN